MNPVPHRASFYLSSLTTVLLLGVPIPCLYLYFAEGWIQGAIVKGLSPSHTGRRYTEKKFPLKCAEMGRCPGRSLVLYRVVPRDSLHPNPMEGRSL